VALVADKAILAHILEQSSTLVAVCLVTNSLVAVALIAMTRILDTLEASLAVILPLAWGTSLLGSILDTCVGAIAGTLVTIRLLAGRVLLVAASLALLVVAVEAIGALLVGVALGHSGSRYHHTSIESNSTCKSTG